MTEHTPEERESIRIADEKRIDAILQAERNAQRDDIQAARESAWLALCPPIYRDTDIHRLPDPVATKRVLAWDNQERGLLIHGPTRAGKSRSAWLLMRTLFDAGLSIRAYDGIGWFFAVGAAFREMEKAEQWLDSLTKADVLFLDDIFRGRMTDAQELALWGVLERRTAHRQPVILTTNATSETIKTKTGEHMAPILSRMTEFCDDVVFKAKQDLTPKRGG